MHNACLIFGGAPQGGESHSLLDIQREIIRCNTVVAVPAALQVVAEQKYSYPKCSNIGKVIVWFSGSPLSAKYASQTLGL